MKKFIGRRELRSKSWVRKKQKENKKMADVTILKTMLVESKMIRCLRCNTRFSKKDVCLPLGNYYCPACIQLGRVDSNLVFVNQAEKARKKRAVSFEWSGELSPQQKVGSKKVVTAIQKKQKLLLWAVTGSGKTEMLFAGLHHALQMGSRVAVASPRIDVCRELYPRLQAVFPDIDILLLYGHSEEKYRYSNFTICTTHQLLRFYQAFDVLIIDEIDAFPFANDPKLAYAVQQALLPKSSLIYLTATPSTKFLIEISTEFDVVKLAARYHRRPLPEPKLLFWNNWWRKVEKGCAIKKLMTLIETLLVNNRLLLFCPSISLMKQLASHLEKKFPKLTIRYVYSEDPEREEKVLAMRAKKIDLLLTTTILERGVTFENISVIVLGANHRVFNQAALVQIAGRVDRKGEFSKGEVYFIYDEMTAAIREALKSIRDMNQKAKQEGLLDEMFLL